MTAPARSCTAPATLVRRHIDGSLEFLGRIDHQVKVRGHRIELGEIEGCAKARSHDLAQAVVVTRGSASDVRLVAYCVAKSRRGVR
jgi:acyl-coenzyme A synthetase/AMP-(fatty) acid ligase